MVDNTIRLSASDLACDDGYDSSWSVVKSHPPVPATDRDVSDALDFCDDEDLEDDCAPSSLAVPPVNFGEIVIQDSTDVHIGNKTFYNGSVTIKQFVISKDEESKLGRLPPTPTSNGTLARSCSHLCEPTKDENQKEQNKLRYLKSPYTIGGIIIMLLVCTLLTVYLVTGFTANVEEIETLPSNASQRLITRGAWLSILKLNESLPLVEKIPAQCLTVVQTGMGTCTAKDYCKSTAKDLQNRDRNSGLPDIRYNFLAGGDGYLYEGLGWDRRGWVCKALDTQCLSLALIGNFVVDPPPPRQLEAVGLLVELGIATGKLDPDLKVYLPEKLPASSESPGKRLIEEIQKWPGGNVQKRVQKYSQRC